MQIILEQQAVKRFLTALALICFSSFQIAVYSSSFPPLQEIKVSIKVENQSVKKVFEQLNQKTGLMFIYDDEVLSSVNNISLNAQNESLDKVLAEVSKQTNLSFKQIDNTISVGRLASTNNSARKGVRQEKFKVKGMVKDSDGEPLAGVSVAIKNSQQGTITDVDGNYELEITSEDTELVFSFIGFITQNETVGKRRSIDITMEERSRILDEVVVVAYGVQKKVNVTGAVASVNGDVLENRPIPSVGAGLQGLLPGVTITSSSGQPGQPGVSINIRGVNTINSSTSPLILIDGVAGGDINLLNPDDIENVSVLKDAASSAIYGARAANGVILVNTKQGKSKDKTSLSYSGYFGIQTPTAMPELVNGRQYMTLENEARSARGVAIPYSEDAFMKYDSQNFPNEYSNTDWLDATFKKTAIQQGHNFNINGRPTENSSYYMSYGILDQNGLVVGDAYNSKRHNIRMRLNMIVFERLKLDGNLSYVDYYRQDAGNSGTAGVFRLVQRISPLLPVKWQLQNQDGSWYDSPYYSYGSVSNPVYTANESGYTRNKSRTMNGIINASLNIIKDLDVNAQYSYNYYSNESKGWSPTMPKYLADGTPHTANESLLNRVSETRRSLITQTLQATVNYEKSISDHNLKLLGGFSQEWEYISNLSGSRRNILLDGIEVIDAGTEDFQNGGTADHWGLRSFFGRVNYNFAEKYLFEANVRYDGTSRFSRNHRWGLFPSFSAGWKFSEESFMDFSKSVLSLGKLRASWGELGNQNIGSTYYHYITEIERVVNSYPIGGTGNVGFVQRSIPNEKIKWEVIRMLNVGADFLFLKNRLDLSFDWFKRENINALLKPNAPTVTGKTSLSELPYENVGSIENKGWEISIRWRDQIGQVRYSLTGNISDSQSKITDLGGSAPSTGDKIRKEGYPVNAYNGYLTDGLAQISDFESYDSNSRRYINPKFPVISSSGGIVQPGDIKYRDISGPDGVPDGIIDDYDKVVFGNPYPRYTFSLRGDVAWRDFDFSFYLQGVGKVNGYLSDEARHAFINDYSIPKTAHLDRWTPNNPNASYPRLYYGQTHNLVFSDYWLEDASYLRLKNIQFGYSLPQKICKKIGTSRIRVYSSIDNLLTFTKYFGGYDPEVRETSGDSYPQVKTFAFGININF